MNQIFYTGVVEDRRDPIMLGRCRVRIVGLHTQDKTQLPTEDLPWAHPMMPINSASMNGIGWSPTGVVQGTWVVVIFLDEAQQQPVMIGTLGGIPQTKSAEIIADITNGVVTTDIDGDLVSTTGDIVTDIVDSIVEESNEGVTQETTKKYHINAITAQLSDGNYTTYNVNANDTEITVATATYDDDKKVYSVTLLKPEQYEDFQYIPFKGTTKDFKTKKEILTYFDKNF